MPVGNLPRCVCEASWCVRQVGVCGGNLPGPECGVLLESVGVRVSADPVSAHCRDRCVARCSHPRRNDSLCHLLVLCAASYQLQYRYSAALSEGITMHIRTSISQTAFAPVHHRQHSISQTISQTAFAPVYPRQHSHLGSGCRSC